MTPWFRGWKVTGHDLPEFVSLLRRMWAQGTIERDVNHPEKFLVTGVIEQLSDTSVEIVELPIHKWTETYKEFLESCIIGSVPIEKDKDKDKDKEKEKKSKVPERFITVCTPHLSRTMKSNLSPLHHRITQNITLDDIFILL